MRNGVNICFVQLLWEEISSFSYGKCGNAKWSLFSSVNTFADILLYAKSRSNHSTKTNSRSCEEMYIISCKSHLLSNNSTLQKSFPFYSYSPVAQLMRAQLLDSFVKFLLIAPNCISCGTEKPFFNEPIAIIYNYKKIITTINLFSISIKMYL